MKKSMFLLLLMTYATYSISAVEVSKTQAHSLHEMGHISVHGDPTVLSPEAAKNALNKKQINLELDIIISLQWELLVIPASIMPMR